MQHPDEGTIHAWLDGELSGAEAEALHAHVTECSRCSAAVAEARGLIAASSRIVSALDGVPSGVIPASSPRPRRAWYLSPQFRAAAVLAVVAGTSLLLADRLRVSGREAVVADDGASMMQQSRAADATTTNQEAVQMASPQPAAPGPVTPSSRAAAPSPPPKAAVRLDGQGAGASRTAAGARQQGVVAESDFAGKGVVTSAGAAAPAPQIASPRELAQAPAVPLPPAPMAPVPERAARQRVANPAPTADVLVTGVAAMAAPALRLVSEDSTGVSRTSVFEVEPGKHVTLTVTPAVRQPAAAALRRATLPAQAAAPAAEAARTAPTVISWEAAGKRYTLSGQFTREELELIRRRLPLPGS